MPRGRRLIAFVVVGLLGVLTPVAYADPPDPTWLAGYWDDADFDTVVDFLASASAVSAPPVNEANPVLASDERVAPAGPLVGISVLQTLAFPRAPPIRLWANG